MSYFQSYLVLTYNREDSSCCFFSCCCADEVNSSGYGEGSVDNVDDIFLIQQLQEGSYGVVSVVSIKDQNQLMVLKKPRGDADNERQNEAIALLKEEERIMREIGPHAHIVTLIGVVKDLYLLLEYCRGGDLYDYLIDTNGDTNSIDEGCVGDYCFDHMSTWAPLAYPVSDDTLSRTLPVDTATSKWVVDDLRHGLMWIGCEYGSASGTNCNDSVIKTSWLGQWNHCSDLDWGGFTDWTIP